MKKNSFYFILTLLAIPVFGFIVYYNFLNIGKNFRSFERPDFDFSAKSSVEEIKNDFLEKNNGYKEYRNPGGNIKFLYPASWTEADPQVLSTINQQLANKGKLLFSAFYMDPFKADAAYLLVEELDYPDADNLIEALNKDASSRNLKLEICEREDLDGKTLLDLKYYSVFSQTDEDSLNFLYFAREAAVFTSGKTYLVAIISSQEKWSEVDQISQEIMDSVEIITVNEAGTPKDNSIGPKDKNENSQYELEKNSDVIE